MFLSLYNFVQSCTIGIGVILCEKMNRRYRIKFVISWDVLCLDKIECENLLTEIHI